MPKIGTTITGACGEHYVASYLSGFGMIVALPRAGVKGSDLFVADQDYGHPLRVQVKTGQDCHHSDKDGKYYAWDTSYSVVDRCDESLWFAYVWLNGWPEQSKFPELFFVPSKLVVDHMKKWHTPEKKRPFFWMYLEVAEKYRGAKGLDAMRTEMKSKLEKTIVVNVE